jgi:glycosyltransferase involved in cell wall biosynthesis
MNLDKKLISIIIASFNASDTIEKCLESIVSQKTNECELLIIDGGSTDHTINIVKSFSHLVDYFISESDSGVYDAWNKGIKASNGVWIMFIGADDILLPNAITTYLNILKHNNATKDVDYICANNEYVDKNGKFLTILGEEPFWFKMRKMNVVAHVASLHNKNRLFNKIGLYDLNFKICADYELLIRKGDKLKTLYVPRLIARMAVGGVSFSTKAIIELYNIRSKHHSVSPLFNVLLFLINWSSFFIFKIRKKCLGAKL